MSFGLGHGRELDPAPGRVGISPEELPPLPDNLADSPESARLDPRQWFPHPHRPFDLEIGSGKGTFLIQQADLEPETNFLGIEWAKEFYLYAADRVRRRQDAGTLTNVRLLHTDATEFIRWRIPDSIVRVIHLYFSDPWPKSRHHKRRVVQDRFLRDAARVLIPGGELRLVTDHPELWAWYEDHMARWTDPDTPPMPGVPPAPFQRHPFERPPSAGEHELVGTNFERKFRQEGRQFHAAILRKPASPSP